MSDSGKQLLPRILRSLSLRERLDLAGMDAELCQEVLTFSDITMASIRTDGVVFGNRWRQLGRGEKSLLGKMTKLEKVVVEKSLGREEWQELFGIGLKKLYLSSMAGLESLPAGVAVNQQTLKTLYILQAMNRPMSSLGVLDGKRMTALLSPSLTRICLTGVRLFAEDLSTLFSLPALVSMDLIGTLVNSETIVQAQTKLKSPPGLEELSLPPSWFSFSSNYDLGYKAHSLRWLTVPKLCLFVHVYDKKAFWNQLTEHMANGMETLVLYGNYDGIKEELERGRKTKIEILFGPNQPQFLSFKGFGDTGLVSHLVKKPPFVIKQKMDYMDWQYRPAEIRKEQKAAAEAAKKMSKSNARRPSRRGRILRRRDQDLETAREPEGEMRTARESAPHEQRSHSRPRRNRGRSEPASRSQRNSRRSGSVSQASNRASRSANRSRRNSSTSRPQRNSRAEIPATGVLTAREMSPTPRTMPGTVASSSSLSVQVGSPSAPLPVPNGQEEEAAVVELVMAQVARRVGELDQEQ